MPLFEPLSEVIGIVRTAHKTTFARIAF